MRVIVLDKETHLIEPGLLAPPPVCLQWQEHAFGTQLGDAQLQHIAHCREMFEEWLDSDARLVGHNLAYDMGVAAAKWPDLLPKIFAKYDRDQITDTLLREQLLMIARGTFRSIAYPSGDVLPVKYSLQDCVRRHFNWQLQKDGWRLFYRAFHAATDVADWPRVAAEFRAQCAAGQWPDWTAEIPAKDRQALLEAPPEQAIEYALDDVRWGSKLYFAQEEYAAKYYRGKDLFADQFRQARAAFALHLSSCWGLYTDPDAVDALEEQLNEEFEALKFELQQAGLIREDGTADTKAAQAAMLRACEEENFPPMQTKGGAVSLSAEACGRFTDEDGNPLPAVGDAAYAIANYSRFLTVRKTLSNDIKMLRAGCEVPVQPRYDLADTGRTRCSKPNIQAINRGAGIREAFRPRPRMVFAQADFEGLELHTLAAWCLEKIGWSKLAETLNAEQDVHLVMAAEFLGITYEEALKRKKDPEVKTARQASKPVNFGLPGGLGAGKLVRYAKVAYGVTMSEAEAKQRKEKWLRRFPEMLEFFRLASAACNNDAHAATEDHIFTGRIRGQARYSALCNGRFQGLGADAAKEALWRVTRAAYCDRSSPLYGSRVVAFVHDEIIVETAEGPNAHFAAQELGRLMIEGANKYLGRVPVRLKPQLMRLWSKAAEPVFDAEGRLVPWEPNMKAPASTAVAA